MENYNLIATVQEQDWKVDIVRVFQCNDSQMVVAQTFAFNYVVLGSLCLIGKKVQF